MSKGKILIGALVLLVIVAGVVFYNAVNNREAPDFKEGVVTPQGIVINEKEIIDIVAAKTIVMEVEKSPLEKATKRDQTNIAESEKAFTIKGIYKAEDPQSGRLDTIVILKDGTFIASKNVNGRLQYAKGIFGGYTLDYLTGLYTLE